MPRCGMAYDRGIVVLANPYCDEPGRKFSAVEVVLPQTGTVKYLCKLPQSLFMPGKSPLMFYHTLLSEVVPDNYHDTVLIETG